jgi:N-acylneuraminate cytidylyltransferase
MNCAIITARKGSETIKNKSLLEVAGNPLIYYPITAALNSKKIGAVYITTDGEDIAARGEKMGCKIIWRPEVLSGPEVNHGTVIKHAVEQVDENEDDLENVVLLLGNTVMVDAQLIDQSLAILEEKAEFDSVMSVWEAADDHPLRALEIQDGCLKPYGGSDRQVSTARQSYPKAYFYDQGVWTFRKYTVHAKDGPNPWWWMGKKSYPIIRKWVTGRDIHNSFDAAVSEWFVKNQERLEKLS